MVSGLKVSSIIALLLALGLYGCVGASRSNINDVPVMSGVMHPVSEEQSVYAIAHAYEVSPQLIIRVNGLDSSGKAPAGKSLFIPGAQEVRTVHVTQQVAASRQPIEITEDGLSHVVRPGETLTGIARAYEEWDVSVSELQRINNIPDASMLYAGQVLWIPRAKEVQDVPLPTAIIVTTAPSPTPSRDPRRTVVVQPTPTPTPTPRPQQAQREFPRAVAEFGNREFQWPIKERFRIVRPYSASDDPRVNNQGIDLGAPIGTEVSAAADGEVFEVGGLADTFGSEWGNYIFLFHGERNRAGVYTIYGHNSENLVKVGDKVRRGQPIARVGATGIPPVNEGGVLHFEIREGVRALNPINVLPSLQ